MTPRNLGTAASVWEYDITHGHKPVSRWTCPTLGCLVRLNHRNGTTRNASSFVHPKRTALLPEVLHLTGCPYDFAAVINGLHQRFGDVITVTHTADPDRTGLDLHIGTPNDAMRNTPGYRSEVLAGAHAIAAFITRHQNEPTVLARFQVRLGPRTVIPWDEFAYGLTSTNLSALTKRAEHGIRHPVFGQAILTKPAKELNQRGRYSGGIRAIDATRLLGFVHTPATAASLPVDEGAHISVLSDNVGLWSSRANGGGHLSIGVTASHDLFVTR